MSNYYLPLFILSLCILHNAAGSDLGVEPTAQETSLQSVLRRNSEYNRNTRGFGTTTLETPNNDGERDKGILHNAAGSDLGVKSTEPGQTETPVQSALRRMSEYNRNNRGFGTTTLETNDGEGDNMDAFKFLSEYPIDKPKCSSCRSFLKSDSKCGNCGNDDAFQYKLTLPESNSLKQTPCQLCGKLPYNGCTCVQSRVPRSTSKNGAPVYTGNMKDQDGESGTRDCEICGNSQGIDCKCNRFGRSKSFNSNNEGVMTSSSSNGGPDYITDGYFPIICKNGKCKRCEIVKEGDNWVAKPVEENPSNASVIPPTRSTERSQSVGKSTPAYDAEFSDRRNSVPSMESSNDPLSQLTKLCRRCGSPLQKISSSCDNCEIHLPENYSEYGSSTVQSDDRNNYTVSGTSNPSTGLDQLPWSGTLLRKNYCGSCGRSRDGNCQCNSYGKGYTANSDNDSGISSWQSEGNNSLLPLFSNLRDVPRVKSGIARQSSSNEGEVKNDNPFPSNNSNNIQLASSSFRKANGSPSSEKIYGVDVSSIPRGKYKSIQPGDKMVSFLEVAPSTGIYNKVGDKDLESFYRFIPTYIRDPISNNYVSTNREIWNNGSRPYEEYNLDQLREFILERHNYYRHIHGVGPLTIDRALNDSSQKYALKLLRKFEPLEHTKNPTYGENLAFYRSSDITRVFPPTDAVDDWYDEIEKYDYGYPENIDDSNGHFTQLLWKESKQIGCGVATGIKETYSYKYVVCHYSPRGNCQGEFKANVPLPLEEYYKAPLYTKVQSPSYEY